MGDTALKWIFNLDVAPWYSYGRSTEFVLNEIKQAWIWEAYFHEAIYRQSYSKLAIPTTIIK